MAQSCYFSKNKPLVHERMRTLTEFGISPPFSTTPLDYNTEDGRQMVPKGPHRDEIIAVFEEVVDASTRWKTTRSKNHEALLAPRDRGARVEN
jgi:hypothetical protein